MTKLDVGRKTYEAACRRAWKDRPMQSWDELTDAQRLWWMEQIVSLAFTGPVFA